MTTQIIPIKNHGCFNIGIVYLFAKEIFYLSDILFYFTRKILRPMYYLWRMSIASFEDFTLLKVIGRRVRGRVFQVKFKLQETIMLSNNLIIGDHMNNKGIYAMKEIRKQFIPQKGVVLEIDAYQ